MFQLKYSILLICMLLHICHSRHGQISNKDHSYEKINFVIPIEVWKQALNPTPVLKSPVTIVLPVHIADDSDGDIDEDVDNEVLEDAEDPIEPTPAQDPIGSIPEEPISDIPVTSIAPIVADVTQKPIIQNEATQSPIQGVNGTVIRFPCRCNSEQCGCCTGALLQRFRMKVCGNISFIPEDFVFDVRLSVNNNTVVRRRVSASDPPPICINPRRAPFVRVCAEISNIRIRNGNAFACLDINADIAGFTIYSASFRCFGLGTSGVQTGLKPKPTSSGPKPINLFGSNNNQQEGTIFDAASGLFGGGSDGPLDAIGDALGDFFDGRNLKTRLICFASSIKPVQISSSAQTRALFTQQAYSQVRAILCFNIIMVKIPFFVIVTVTLFFRATGNIADNEPFNITNLNIQESEWPDNSSLVSRLKMGNFSVLSHFARQEQDDGQNGSTTSSNRRCTCSLGVCKCCTGYVLDLFKQKACMKVTYHPGDFAFDVAMSMNDRILYENSMSGKNPRPICINPPRMPNLKICARFYNVFFPGRNFHFCLAMTGKWRALELFNLVFDCLRMGANGIAMIRPEENGGLPIPNPQGGVDAVIDAGEDDIEEYDEQNIVRSLLEIFDR
ncbi:uncharacterized protein LOC119829371 [Zerene cesonia]|uniref:uncharacterized protein LOC119829371 n=1 Tax=Zerene cesonia TaxID=33412 RepID=UPI0018E52A45|nr:uncharacterized protein LOC119829371 [Zerene cesonia]